jgi:hypothetical protein
VIGGDDADAVKVVMVEMFLGLADLPQVHDLGRGKGSLYDWVSACPC